MLLTPSIPLKTPLVEHVTDSTDTGSVHKILDFLGFLSTCSNAEPCVVFAAFLVPIDWSAAPRFLGLLVTSTVLTPDWASVAACCRPTTRAPDWAGGHVMFTLDSAAPSLQDAPPCWGLGSMNEVVLLLA